MHRAHRGAGSYFSTAPAELILRAVRIHGAPWNAFSPPFLRPLAGADAFTVCIELTDPAVIVFAAVSIAGTFVEDDLIVTFAGSSTCIHQHHVRKLDDIVLRQGVWAFQDFGPPQNGLLATEVPGVSSFDERRGVGTPGERAVRVFFCAVAVSVDVSSIRIELGLSVVVVVATRFSSTSGKAEAEKAREEEGKELCGGARQRHFNFNRDRAIVAGIVQNRSAFYRSGSFFLLGCNATAVPVPFARERLEKGDYSALLWIQKRHVVAHRDTLWRFSEKLEENFQRYFRCHSVPMLSSVTRGNPRVRERSCARVSIPSLSGGDLP